MKIWKNQKFWVAVQAVLIYVWLTDLSALAGTDTYTASMSCAARWDCCVCGTTGKPHPRGKPL